MVHFFMLKNQSRRNFLRTAPAAAAVSLTLTDELMAQTPASCERRCHSSRLPLSRLPRRPKALDAKPGDNSLFTRSFPAPYSGVDGQRSRRARRSLSGTRAATTWCRFWRGRRCTRWAERRRVRTAASRVSGMRRPRRGTKSIMMSKGDMLVIPRNTLHKRSTEDASRLR